MSSSGAVSGGDRQAALSNYARLVEEHGVREAALKESKKHDIFLVRFNIRDLEKQYNKSENDIKALQSVGQIIAEVLKQIDEEKCNQLSDQL